MQETLGDTEDQAVLIRWCDVRGRVEQSFVQTAARTVLQDDGRCLPVSADTEHLQHVWMRSNITILGVSMWDWNESLRTYTMMRASFLNSSVAPIVLLTLMATCVLCHVPK